MGIHERQHCTNHFNTIFFYIYSVQINRKHDKRNKDSKKHDKCVCSTAQGRACLSQLTCTVETVSPVLLQFSAASIKKCPRIHSGQTISLLKIAGPVGIQKSSFFHRPPGRLAISLYTRAFLSSFSSSVHLQSLADTVSHITTNSGLYFHCNMTLKWDHNNHNNHNKLILLHYGHLASFSITGSQGNFLQKQQK